MYNYLIGRKQRTRIGSTFSSWLDIIRGVPQGSILGPFCCSIYLLMTYFLNCLKLKFVTLQMTTRSMIVEVV